MDRSGTAEEQKPDLSVNSLINSHTHSSLLTVTANTSPSILHHTHTHTHDSQQRWSEISFFVFFRAALWIFFHPILLFVPQLFLKPTDVFYLGTVVS